MKEENLQISLLEKMILHCFMDNPNLIINDIDYFVSPQATELYYDIITLKNDNKDVTPEHILTMDNYFIDSNMLISVQETHYQLSNLEEYKNKLRQKFVLHEFRVNSLNDLDEDCCDEEKLNKISEEFEKAKNQIKNEKKENDPMSFSDLIEEYKTEIEKRSKGISYTTGDYNLDKLIPNPQAGLIGLVGMSGSMKSTFIIKLLRNRITKRLPTVAFNTELTHATYMDTLTSTMIDENYSDLTGDNDENIDWETIKNKLNELEDVYSKRGRNFAFYPKNEISLDDIMKFSLKCRKDFNLKDDDILFGTIDLALMVKDANDPKLTRADAITQFLNKLNIFALENNILFIMTYQIKKQANKITINDLSDLDKFKITTEVIKESGSIEERNRILLAIHNPKYLVNKNQCSEVIKNLVEPILELTVIKNSWKNNVGETIYYYIDNEHKDLIDYVPMDGEIPNSMNVVQSTEENNDNDGE